MILRGVDVCPRHQLPERKIKPGAYMAFVGREKIKKTLQAKQRQREQKLLLKRAYLSFVISFYLRLFNFCAKVYINFYLCKKNLRCFVRGVLNCFIVGRLQC